MADLHKLKNQREIIAVGGSNLASYEANQIADISAPTFFQSGANIVTVEPLKTFGPNAILQPFSWYVWILIIVTIPFSGLSLYVLGKYSSNSADQLRLRDAMWTIAVILCWDSITIKQPSAPKIILLSTFMLTTLVLVSEYFSYYTSFMVSPSYIRDPIEKTEELWESDLKWIGGRMTEYYKDNFNSTVKDLESRLLYLNPKELKEETKSATEILVANPDGYAYFEKQGVVEWGICHHKIDLKNRKMYYSKETIGDYNTYMYFPKGSVYTEPFNRRILLLHGTGIIRMNQRSFVNNVTHFSCYEQEKISADMITLGNMKSGFYLLVIGYVISLLCIGREMLTILKVNTKIQYFE